MNRRPGRARAASLAVAFVVISSGCGQANDRVLGGPEATSSPTDAIRDDTTGDDTGDTTGDDTRPGTPDDASASADTNPVVETIGSDVSSGGAVPDTNAAITPEEATAVSPVATAAVPPATTPVTTPVTAAPTPATPPTSAPTQATAPVSGPCPIAPHLPDKVAGCGDTGDLVESVQTLLVCHGYAVAVTGRFDAATYAAVVAFQSANRLDVDGLAGPSTQTALFEGCADF